MDKISLALKITNWCNLNCAHCSERSGPSVAPNIMPISDVRNYIAQFRDMRAPKWNHLVFTGGETMAPYFHGEQKYIPQCIDASYNAGFIPYFKTNGMWGGNQKMCDGILNDLADAAYRYNNMTTIEISLDEFHNNITQTARIISDVVKNARLNRAIRISLAGLDTPMANRCMIDLLGQICARRMAVRFVDDMTIRVEYGTLSANVYFDFGTPVSIAGRAVDNKLGTQPVSGMPGAGFGSCLQIDNAGIATLNYKWREPVAGLTMDELATKLMRRMNENSRQK